MSVITPDQFDFTDFLLEELQQEGVLTESFVKLQKAEKTLFERKVFPEEEILTENQNTPDVYYYHDHEVRWDRFKAIYSDYEGFPTRDDVMNALGLPRASFPSTAAYEKLLGRIRKHFNSNRKTIHGQGIVAFDRRKQFYFLDRVPEADIDNIDPGRRGQKKPSSRIIDNINKQPVVPGEFYNDMSRIPRRRWGSWITRWARQKQRIKNPKPFLGRRWAKTFILGYQLDKKLVVEVWYSSATSEFNVYDQNGVDLGRPSASLQEAIRLFVNFLLRQQTTDKEIFQGGMDASVANSFMNALKSGAERDTVEVQREDELARQEELRSMPNARTRAKYSRPSSIFKAGQKTFDAGVAAASFIKRKVDEGADARRATVDALFREFERANRTSSTPDSEFISKREFEQMFGQAHAEKEAEQEAREQSSRGNVAAIGQDRQSNRLGTDNAIYLGKKTGRPSRSGGAVTPEVIELGNNMSPDVIKQVRAYNDAIADMNDYRQNVEALKIQKRMLDTTPSMGGSAAAKTRSNKIKGEIKKAETELERQQRAIEAFERYFKAKGIPYTNDQRRLVNEKYSPDDIRSFDFEAAEREMDAQAANRRILAAKSGFTGTALKTSIIEDMITTYSESRVEKKSRVFDRILRKEVFRGRAAALEQPGDISFYDRLRMSMKGMTYRADFVIGFSLQDKVNIEVWYVSRPDISNPSKTVSSFYVYDVTAQRLLRANLPYMRNAVQIALAKIGVS